MLLKIIWLYDSAPKPQRSCFANPSEEAKKRTYFFFYSILVVLCKKILVTSPTLHFQTHIPTGLSEPGKSLIFHLLLRSNLAGLYKNFVHVFLIRQSICSLHNWAKSIINEWSFCYESDIFFCSIHITIQVF